jgi:regulator of cell morphogenesis and NO signaling
LSFEINSAISTADRDWTSVPIDEFIRYLAAEEHVWFRRELSQIAQLLKTAGKRDASISASVGRIAEVFAQLAHDLDVHMFHEEAEVFPEIHRYIVAFNAGTPIKGSPLSRFGGPLRLMEHEHETVGSALRLMRDFGQNYVAPEGCCSEYAELLRRLAELEDRLLRHIYLENNVLFPRAASLKADTATKDS